MIHRVFVILLLAVYTVNPLSGQRITGTTAEEALTSGNYEVAYEQYRSLLGTFPRDSRYLYGAAVALINMERQPAEALSLLKRASEYSTAIRPAPDDLIFYKGRAYHLNGMFGDAIEAYEKYGGQLGRRAARRAGIPDLIGECREERGAIAEPPGEVYDDVPPAEPAGELRVLPDTTDNLLAMALELRRKAEGAPDQLRSDLIRRSDSLLAAAGVPGIGAADATVSRDMAGDMADLVAADSLIDDTIVDADTLIDDTIVAEHTLAAADTLVADTTDAAVTDIADTTDTAGFELDREALAGAATGDTLYGQGMADEPEPMISLFEILDSPFYSDDNPVTISGSFPEGLLYSIQFGAFRNRLDPSYFRGLYPVFGILTPGREVTFYYTGLFRQREDAVKAVGEVREHGFRDAFVVHFLDSRAVSEERAVAAEPDWADKPLPEWEGVVPAVAEREHEAPRDTVPPALMLRVEVVRTESPDDERLVAQVNRLAGDRGFDILNPEEDLYIFVVGNFITFESATSYADLLRRNGYDDARVAAYVGKTEIPLEAALRLLNIER